MAAVSFENDVMPILFQFKGQMMWRLDLTSYEQVKANAQLIYDVITAGPDSPHTRMPAPPFPPLTESQIQTFKQWMVDGLLP
jgi:hypothetical protein